MAGLSLRAGAGVGASSPLLPVPAGQPTGPAGGSATSAAFGIGVSGAAGARTAAIGAGLAGAGAALILLWLWWSLPR